VFVDSNVISQGYRFVGGVTVGGTLFRAVVGRVGCGFDADDATSRLVRFCSAASFVWGLSISVFFGGASDEGETSDSPWRISRRTEYFLCRCRGGGG